MNFLSRQVRNKIREILKPPIISQEKKILASVLPPNPIIVEAGAHNGYDTIQMARLWQKGSIYAFEPVPATYTELEANTSHLKNVKRFPLALSPTTGQTEIYISDNWTASSSLMTPKEHLNINPQVVFNRKTKINTINLDEWMEKNQISVVDFMWLDMQGMELEVLKSAPKAIMGTKLIYTEVHIRENYEGVPMYEEVKNWLFTQGFDVFFEDISFIDGGNVAFVRK